MVDVEPLIARVDLVVSALVHGGSVSEYQLITLLTDDGTLPRDSASTHLSLFQKHFLVMHSLYVLRKRYIEQDMGVLSISATKICFQPRAPLGGHELSTESESVELADYYCDLDNLLSQTEEGVIELLDGFWRDFSEYQQVNTDDLDSALTLFDLSLPFEKETLNKAYRKIMQSTHPDKGGDQARFIEAQEAYVLLRTRLKLNQR